MSDYEAPISASSSRDTSRLRLRSKYCTYHVNKLNIPSRCLGLNLDESK